jgi:hypothetical protein
MIDGGSHKMNILKERNYHNKEINHKSLKYSNQQKKLILVLRFGFNNFYVREPYLKKTCIQEAN